MQVKPKANTFEAYQYQPGVPCDIEGAAVIEHEYLVGHALLLISDGQSAAVRPGDWIVKDHLGNITRQLDQDFYNKHESMDGAKPLVDPSKKQPVLDVPAVADDQVLPG